MKKSGIGLLFSPHFNVPLRCPVPFVATIHDLILHRFPNEASSIKQFAYQKLMKHTVEKSRELIAVSEFTAKEITEEFGEEHRRKMRVISEGVGAAFSKASEDDQAVVRRKYGIEHPFFLYVGNAKAHKNIPALLEGFTRANVPDHSLVLVAGGKEAEVLSLPQSVIRIDSVPEKELAALYSAATSFVTASLYEGFCLPIVEARACGCPVIAVNRTAIPEVADGDALLIEPDPESIAKALHIAAGGTLPRTERKTHSWEKAAKETLAVLQGVLALQ
jgi:glycosyltransferase involved in cell wall biosynthesis